MFRTLYYLSRPRPLVQKSLQLVLSSKTTLLALRHTVIKHSSSCHFSSTSSLSSAMNLRDVVRTLETIAPCNLAEDWDNVGLLVEPSNTTPINNIMLTNDLTESIMKEVLKLKDEGVKIDLIISYHPPIFRPLKRLTQSSAKERIIVKAIELGVAVYSPHTAHDALWGGVNDWLLSGLGEGVVTPLSVKEVLDGKGLCFRVGGIKSKDDCQKVMETLKLKDSLITMGKTVDNQDVFSISCSVDNHSLTQVVPVGTDLLKDYSISISPAGKVPVPSAGRFMTFSNCVSLQTLIQRVKSHLGLHHIRLALPDGVTEESVVTSVAVCVGSGASVLRGVKADVFITGEMSHHDVLDVISRNIACILCEHSNTERGFLKVFKAILETKLDTNIRILVSQTDKDPINIV